MPSGADATTAIAIYLCGSEDEFVKLMNEKVEELGLKNTHFTNASGLYDPNHYSTATDIAMLMSGVLFFVWWGVFFGGLFFGGGGGCFVSGF